MWTRTASLDSGTWLYFKARDRRAIDAQIERHFASNMPDIIEYDVSQPGWAVIFSARGSDKSTWTYIDLADGHWWYEENIPEVILAARDARATFEGAGIA